MRRCLVTVFSVLSLVLSMATLQALDSFSHAIVHPTYIDSYWYGRIPDSWWGEGDIVIEALMIIAAATAALGLIGIVLVVMSAFRKAYNHRPTLQHIGSLNVASSAASSRVAMCRPSVSSRCP